MVGLITFGVSIGGLLEFLPEIPEYEPERPLAFCLAAGWRVFVSLVVTAVVNRLVLSGLLPALRYVPQSIAMGNMGLERISAGEDRYADIVKRCLKNHNCAEHGKVRAICISGRYLFREENMPNGKKCPLHELGRRGCLDVIMPVSEVANPTIESRFETYSSDFKASTGLRTSDDLVSEIRRSKDFLRDVKGNQLTEHRMLCIWRVVIFRHQCVVQSYFPNTASQESYLAPVFVFSNRPEVVGSYYATFEHTFELVKRYGASLLSDTPVGASAGSNRSHTVPGPPPPLHTQAMAAVPPPANPDPLPKPSIEGDQPARKFLVAFSFAGQKRDFVDAVARILARCFGEEAILYDKFREAEFARHDLATYLGKLYSEESELIVPILCPDYDKGLWTGWEWMRIYGLFTKNDGHRVMPCRFDYAKVEGVGPTFGFAELDDKTPRQTAILILRRLASNRGHPNDHYLPLLDAPD